MLSSRSLQPALWLLAFFSLLILPGCSTFESRAKERATVFTGLDEPTRARLEAGEIRVGDTTDMVYIALGQPSEKSETLDASGSSSTWIYSIYWQEYQGTRFVGHRREMVYNPATKSYQVSYTPDYQPIYAPRVEDRLRVTFRDGRVTVIEQAQPEAAPQDGAVK